MVNFDDFTTGYTKVPNKILDLVLLGALSHLESRVFLYLWKEYRIRKSPILINRADLAESLGLSRKATRRISQAVNSLVDMNYLYRKKFKQTFKYSFDAFPKEERNAFPLWPESRSYLGYASWYKAGTHHWLDAVPSADFTHRNKSLNKLFKLTTLINPVIWYIENNIVQGGEKVNQINFWANLQKEFDAELLILGIAQFSKNSMLDDINSPVVAHSWVRKYIIENRTNLENEIASYKFTAMNHISVAFDKVINGDDLNDHDRMALSVCDGWGDEKGVEVFESVVQSGLLTKGKLQEHSLMLMNSQFQNIFRVGLPII